MDIAVATAQLRGIYHRCKSHSSMRQTLFQNWLLSSMFVAGKRLWGNLTESAGHTGFWYRSRHCWVRAHLEAGVDSSLPLPPPGQGCSGRMDGCLCGDRGRQDCPGGAACGAGRILPLLILLISPPHLATGISLACPCTRASAAVQL